MVLVEVVVVVVVVIFIVLTSFDIEGGSIITQYILFPISEKTAPKCETWHFREKARWQRQQMSYDNFELSPDIVSTNQISSLVSGGGTSLSMKSIRDGINDSLVITRRPPPHSLSPPLPPIPLSSYTFLYLFSFLKTFFFSHVIYSCYQT